MYTRRRKTLRIDLSNQLVFDFIHGFTRDAEAAPPNMSWSPAFS
jgi:hypothetical protein